MKRGIAVVAAMAIAIGLTGCGGGSPTVTDSKPAETVPAAGGESEQAKATSDAKFGQTTTYDSGVKMTLGVPAEFKPSESAAGAEGGGTPVKIEVTLENAGSKPFNPSTFYATARSGSTECEGVYDTAQKIGDTPSTELAPGEKVVFTIAFAVSDPKDITVQASPDLGMTMDHVTYKLG